MLTAEDNQYSSNHGVWSRARISPMHGEQEGREPQWRTRGLRAPKGGLMYMLRRDGGLCSPSEAHTKRRPPFDIPSKDNLQAYSTNITQPYHHASKHTSEAPTGAVLLGQLRNTGQFSSRSSRA
jgi:hypothetical protein